MTAFIDILIESSFRYLIPLIVFVALFFWSTGRVLIKASKQRLEPATVVLTDRLRQAFLIDEEFHSLYHAGYLIDGLYQIIDGKGRANGTLVLSMSNPSERYGFVSLAKAVDLGDGTDMTVKDPLPYFLTEFVDSAGKPFFLQTQRTNASAVSPFEVRQSVGDAPFDTFMMSHHAGVQRLQREGFSLASGSSAGGALVERQQALFATSSKTSMFKMLRGPARSHLVEPLNLSHTPLSDRLRLANISPPPPRTF